jgi:hypothetical protein
MVRAFLHFPSELTESLEEKKQYKRPLAKGGELGRVPTPCLCILY